MKKIILLIIMCLTTLAGCIKSEILKFSDLDGYWVDEYIYKHNEGIDKVIQFEGNNMIVYSYYDKGTTIYKCHIKESNIKKLSFLLDKNNELVELEKINEDKYRYTVDGEDLYIIRITEDEAKKLIDVIDKYSEY